ncbi:hypothetical protein ACED56_07505 [Vibrio splendidus]|uniref:hypothetical protein n=1 Tax=Vibrio splendidus TaxID=29497 RepID=UPI00352C4893
MGKKSRKKRERRTERNISKQADFPSAFSAFNYRLSREDKSKNEFAQKRSQMRLFLEKYRRIDAAVAIGVSELWPQNVASSVKHSFTWMTLLGIKNSSLSSRAISTYDEFKEFTTELYKIWPEFPTLEDFSPEADWGQVKVGLGTEFVPMFYGSCIERTPDFVEAFCITNAGNTKALAYMDLSIAVQASIISSIPNLSDESPPTVSCGSVQVPPESFWSKCQSALLKVGNEVSEWRVRTDDRLEVRFGEYTGQDTEVEFGDSVMRGEVVPFLAVVEDDYWIPISVRSLPGVVIDCFANLQSGVFNAQVHNRLAEFVSDRFRQTYNGPITLVIGKKRFDNLPISCVIADQSGLYLICACNHASYKNANQVASDVYSALNCGQMAYFILSNGQIMFLSREGSQGPRAADLKIVVVVTQSSTTFGSISSPVKPTRLIPLADFITIFDGIGELSELVQFWEYSDDQQGMLNIFSSGPADLFASFKDSHGVLVEGAIKPTMIMLDTQWGSNRRFLEQSSFWSLAPPRFPDNTTGWRLKPSTEGVTRLESRHQPVCGYSTQLGPCTVQALLVIAPDMQPQDGRMIEMFAQILVDGFQQNKSIINGLYIFQQPHLVIECKMDPHNAIDLEGVPETLGDSSVVIVGASQSNEKTNKFLLTINPRAVMAGLHNAVDASFENRCIDEALQCCYGAIKLHLSDDLKEQLNTSSSKPARFHLQIVERIVDVPDHPDPLIPYPADYKRARQQLAISMKQLGLMPGQYELREAKVKIDSGRDYLRNYIEKKLSVVDKQQLIQRCIEQHDELLTSERVKIQRLRQSLSHEVEFDQLEAAEEARKEFGTAALNYRYLLEKVLTTSENGTDSATDEVLRELVGLVDWYKVMANASDVLHNGADVGGIKIDESYIPEIFYSSDSSQRDTEFARVYAKHRLGINTLDEDEVSGSSDELLDDSRLRSAFIKDLGFELRHLLTALGILSQASRFGLGEGLAFSYVATPGRIAQILRDSIENISESEVDEIVRFLTLSEQGILRLSGKDIDEGEVPYWEHTKRIHRYAIRPLVNEKNKLRWGAETVSRALNIWSSSVKDGYLPADLALPSVKPVIESIKRNIEKELEERTADIFRRHTPYVKKGIDFKRKFKHENFDDVGDFDVLAYWPESNTLIAVECKYNQPPYSIKDSRRLRDKIFGKTVEDKSGQYSKIARRRVFINQHRSCMIELLNWPNSNIVEPVIYDLYVSREVYYWMVYPPYPTKTSFIRVDALDNWIRESLLG